MRWVVVATPIGPVSIGVVGDGVRAVHLRPGRDELAGAAPPEAEPPGAVPPEAEPAGAVPPEAEPAGAERARDLLATAADQVRAYFAGERTGFDLPLCLPEDRGSEFERAIWAELARIPYGEMRTYGAVAAAVGDPGAARSVGTACNRNPVPLLIPCHRVVGAGGKLVGFGAGLPRKRWLLEHEARVSLERAWS